MKDFCVIGSGIAGSILAKTLSKKYSVEIFEKSRGVGGRASNRRFKNNLSFDHGLQYISPKTKSFSKFIKKLEKEKIIMQWKGLHVDLFNHNKPDQKKFIGINGNNAISKYLTKKVKINFLSNINKVIFHNNFWEVLTLNNDKKKFKNIVFCIPYPQIKKIAKKYLNKDILNLKIKMKPNLTCMVIYKNSKNFPISSIKLKDEKISWISNENSKKRFKTNLQVWTIQASQKYSDKYINVFKKKKGKVKKEIVQRFEEIVGLKNKNIIFSDIHGWKYSYNYLSTNKKSFWSEKFNLGICGDWFLGPRAENAWESAQDLCKKIY